MGMEQKITTRADYLGDLRRSLNAACDTARANHISLRQIADELLQLGRHFDNQAFNYRSASDIENDRMVQAAREARKARQDAKDVIPESQRVAAASGLRVR
jgi:hypothetical protein